jgi:hypothetical protein
MCIFVFGTSFNAHTSKIQIVNEIKLFEIFILGSKHGQLNCSCYLQQMESSHQISFDIFDFKILCSTMFNMVYEHVL